MGTVLGWVGAGAGAGGQILMALGKGPLRTGQLTEQIHHFSPRSVYRYASTLEKGELIERFEEAGVPSTVILSLTEPSGRNLYALLVAFAATPLSRLPSEGRDFESWASLNLLGQMWESGLVEEFSHGSRTLTQLAKTAPDLTFHQVNRRLNTFTAGGLLARLPESHLKEYEITDQARRRMALVASIGRWRHRHIHAVGAPGLTLAEMVTLLRTAMPLAVFPEHIGMSMTMAVVGAVDDLDENGRRTSAMLRGTVNDSGTMDSELELGQVIDGSATATVNTWFAALLDGNRGRMQVRGDLKLVDSLLTQLYDVLWGKSDTLALPSAAEAERRMGACDPDDSASLPSSSLP